jgi:hypothetical protein
MVSVSGWCGSGLGLGVVVWWSEVRGDHNIPWWAQDMCTYGMVCDMVL